MRVGRVEGVGRENPTAGATRLRAWIVSIPIVASVLSTTMYGAGNMVLLPTLVLLSLVTIARHDTIDLRKEHFFLFLFWLSLFLSTIISKYVTVHSDMASFFLAALFLGLAGGVSFSPREVRLIVYVYIVAAVFASGSTLINALLGHEAVWHRYSTSFFGVDRDPNYVAAYIVPAVLLCGVALIHGARRVMAHMVLLMILVLGLLATGSRLGAVVLGLTAVLLIGLAVQQGSLTPQRLVFVAVAVLALLVLTIGWLVPLLPDTLIARLTDPSSLLHDPARLDAWALALPLFLEHPILGLGMNSANAYLEQNLGYGSHNVYLDILTGGGLVGTILFVATLASILQGKSGDRATLWSMAAVYLAPLVFINGFGTLSVWVPVLVLWIAGSASRRWPFLVGAAIAGRQEMAVRSGDLIPARNRARGQTGALESL